MPLVSDNFYKKKLDKFGINIKTKYFVGNKIYERNTNNSVNDDIKSGIRFEKDYYLKKNLIHKELDFDSRIEYTFISNEMEEENYKCSNCGMESKLKDFEDGCPYCKTYYNIDYSDKDLGSKYHYDRVLRNNSYRVVTAVIDFIISLIICYFFIKTTSRTFNVIDVTKIFIYGFILSLVLYYLFYVLDAYIILSPIKKYKDKQNKKQIDFWNRMNIDKKSFFNNFNYEVRKFYYNIDNVIDFDVLDYLEFNDFKKGDNLYIKVLAEVRVVYFDDGKINSKILKEEYLFMKNPNDKLLLEDGVNMIKCHNCGASIDVNVSFCEYCHTELRYLQDWILKK